MRHGMIAAVDKGLNLANDGTKLIPGHGPLATKADLKNYRDMLVTVSGRIRSAIKEGKKLEKLEEVVASKPTAEFDQEWGKGFLAPEKFVACCGITCRSRFASRFFWVRALKLKTRI